VLATAGAPAGGARP